MIFVTKIIYFSYSPLNKKNRQFYCWQIGSQQLCFVPSGCAQGVKVLQIKWNMIVPCLIVAVDTAKLKQRWDINNEFIVSCSLLPPCSLCKNIHSRSFAPNLMWKSFCAWYWDHINEFRHVISRWYWYHCQWYSTTHVPNEPIMLIGLLQVNKHTLI